uniref:Protein SYS1 homolog n=1 Tax=Panagrellus redivivus TaxID=6233 RepID=A0A7E4UW21_PANRE
MANFRTNTWDPTLIVGQILAMQSIFYFSESVFMLAVGTFSSYRPSVDHVFVATTIRPMTIVQLLAAVVCAYALTFVVQRAKQCLDFATTLHIGHAIIVTIYNGFIPTSFTWWLLQVVSAAVMTVAGEYLCMQLETLEIPLSTAPLQRTESSEV